MKNLRFYHKVNLYYKNLLILLDKYENKISNETKVEILEHIFVLKYISDFEPEISYTHKNSKQEDEVIKENLDLEIFSKILGTYSVYEMMELHERYESAQKLIDGFVENYRLNGWGNLIAEDMINYNIENNKMEEIIKQSNDMEEDMRNKKENEDLLDEFHSLEISEGFYERLYENILKVINSLHISNFYFYHKIFERYEKSMAENFKNIAIKIIDNYLGENPKVCIDDIFHRPKINDIYYQYIDNKIKSVVYNFSFKEMLLDYYHNKSSFDFDKGRYFFSNCSENDFKDVLWANIEDDGFRNRKRYIYRLINDMEICLSKDLDKSKELRNMIVKLLHDKIKENPNSKIPIEMWLEEMDNFNKK